MHGILIHFRGKCALYRVKVCHIFIDKRPQKPMGDILNQARKNAEKLE